MFTLLGCDRGIGHALARRFDLDGYKVFAGCLDANCPQARDLAEKSVSGLVLVQMDVRDRKQVAMAAETITHQLGNNSGLIFQIYCDQMITNFLHSFPS